MMNELTIHTEELYPGGDAFNVVAEGVLSNRRFLVLTNGICPMAYVAVTDEEAMQTGIVDELNDLNCSAIRVHGGFTFRGKRDKYIKSDEIFSGWDYGHLFDYLSHHNYDETKKYEKKWTLSEILMEVAFTIGQINMMLSQINKTAE